MKYVYGCKNPKHPQVEVECLIKELDSLTMKCEECGQEMHRIPQTFRWGWAHGLQAIKWGAENFRRYRAGKPRLDYPE